MSLRKTLFAFVLLMILMIAAISAVQVYENRQLARGLQELKERHVRAALLCNELSFSALQIQQWLTDVSATRGAEGFDDGWAEAEKYRGVYEERTRDLAPLLDDEPELGARLERALATLPAYYETGRRMARAYVDEGPQAGNALMGEFDEKAGALWAETDSLRDALLAGLDQELDRDVASGERSAGIGIWIGLFALAVCAIFGWFLARRVLRPIGATVGALADIAEGGADLTRRLSDHGVRELDALGHCFNRVMERFQDLIGRMARGAETLHGWAGNLADSAHSVSAGAGETRTQASTVAAAAEELTQTMGELARQSGLMAGELESENHAISEITASIEQITASTRESAEVAARAASLAQESDAKIVQLTEAAASIDRVVEAIQDIADQIDLLALNATIEAARAGESGKGFAVVASEVKGLASQTSESIEEIRTRIEGIQESSRNAASAVAAIQEVVQQVHQLADQVEGAIGEQSRNTGRIESAIHSATDGHRELCQAIDDSASASREISASIASVDAASTENAQSSSGILENSQQVAQLAEELRGLAHEFVY